MIGGFAQILCAALISTVSIFCLASGVLGWHIRKATFLERGFLIVAAIILIKNTYVANILGLSIVATVLIKVGAHRILWHKFSERLNNKNKELSRLR